MAEMRLLDLGDVELCCDVAEPKGGSDELVLCAHGFPDDARSFREQVGFLNELGFRVACPTMRGYAPSGVSRSGRYDAEMLGRDLVAIADRLSPDKPVRLIGHDWGAVAAYAATALAPSRFSHVVTIAVPHVRATLTRLLRPAQARRSWYMFYFQLKGIADRGLARDDFALIDKLWRDWSPSYDARPEDLARIKDGMRDRVEHVIGYYRAFFSPSSLFGRARELLLRPTDVPALYLHGEEDGCIGVELVDGIERHFKRGVAVHRIPRAGHFVHLEQPSIVNPLLGAFLRS